MNSLVPYHTRRGAGRRRGAISILSKGQQVLVVGELGELRTWADPEGNARASLEVQARHVRFLSTLEEAQGLAPGPDLPAEGGEEEIPF